MNQNQLDQEAGIFQKANEYRQKSSNTTYVISFLFGLLIIIAGYTVFKLITEYVGEWATVVLIAVFAILIMRKL